MTHTEAKAAIAKLKREMRERGIRQISCFNGGLTQDERYYNTELFKLKSVLLERGK